MLTTLKINSPENFNNLSDAVYDSVLRAIEGGLLKPGAIMSEVAISKQLNVSRTPVHDAFRQLGKDGIIEQASGHRARIVEYTSDDVFEIFEMRKLLEGEAASLAAGKMDQRHLVPLKETCLRLREIYLVPDWYSLWREHDMEFHRKIAECSGNKRLAADISRYWMLRCGIVHVALDKEIYPTIIAAHLEILEALQDRDDVAAKQAMVHHISTCQKVYVKQLVK